MWFFKNKKINNQDKMTEGKGKLRNIGIVLKEMLNCISEGSGKNSHNFKPDQIKLLGIR